MKYKIVVFDLDGTLVNSIYDLAEATNEGLKAAGLPTHPVEAYKTFVGNGREVLVKKAMHPCTDEKKRSIVAETFDSYYALHLNDHTEAYDGCRELLEKLRDSGIKTAVLSNKPDEFVGAILDKTYPGFSFTAAWGKKPELPRKPDGASLNKMLFDLGLERSDCLYIGDSDVDVFTAINAGVDMLGVEWGFRGRRELLSAGAPKVAATPQEIWRYIND